ncbi:MULTISPECIES: tRNA (mnm(5)s(2)U34)-methyltransferase [Brevibacillus]|uniref:16S rRNA (Cytosine(1402)-N(4))-methyltransferase n=1 Tax=Brevibacillus formosus TaxID=54913 RepID=A0A220MH03_9BACL|nr:MULTISPECIES: class I SAM-dependent methyltransferase [Brevibacillus]ASJ54265.1 16S rRNA (cytosine(1402)-N(4))-methyltransferase [Brevibacillus formosus]PSJ70357.1 methyltransferase domain-containing protein [Brevibacillus brevis]RED30246.1 putative rRNA methylase [Brevibacillus brevis]TQK75124.1 putative rRNA methylase [Brevibacillus sp. AG162]VEF88793.1 Ubiquinone/menaquinone biosynthesis methyltransferase ubiE [Brevibacillus brevis]
MFPNVLEVARKLIRERVQVGETVVDATMGNGNDTLFLAQLVQEEGKVIAFDIQPQAIEKTRERLEREGLANRVEMKLASHEEIDKLEISAAAIMFNLGYLPGGDKEITTQASSTIQAIQSGLRVLRPGGIMTVMIYWGHPAGETEKEAVEAFCHELSQLDYLVLKYQYINQQNQAPFLLAIERRGQ